MPPSPFVDHVRIYFKSGRGGNGAVAWRREKYIPKGGPDGGDGGRGGHVILEGNAQLWTLLDLKYRKYINAEKGQNGAGANKTGRNGKDEILQVPLGTVVRNEETDEIVGEITEDGQQLVLLEGGHGGRGNFSFKSATNRAPTKAMPGGPEREMTAVLELKVLADVGLVGFPNAGKSTLLSVVTSAKPKIAAYPFTTLVPNLGIVKYREYSSFVIADIPGIIEGAHEGRGLGHQFLRHIERNSVLLFMVSVESEDPRAEYQTLLDELKAYEPDLLQKDRLLAITKTDLVDEDQLKRVRQNLDGLEYLLISSVANAGMKELKDILWKMIHQGTEKRDEW